MQPKPGWRAKGYWLAASRAGSLFFRLIAPAADRLVFRLSGGRQTAVSLIAGLPSLVLTVRGTRSGKPRTVTLLGIPDQGRFIVIGSNFGQEHNPAWYYNLRAQGDVTVTLDGKTAAYRARQVFGSEHRQCWEKAVKIYRGYEAYKERARRPIPIFVLEPQE
ncbi:MAG TPA: nitroreductase family deazaflavin-dependent oxidoreductase [Anaerolineales bacterium]|nr:nitroreductase family deazaflavin-dependent oxidoreductase [Anaerolineales bacterium]